MAALPLDLHQGKEEDLDQLAQFLTQKSASGYVTSYKTFGMQEVLYSFGLLPAEVVEAMNRSFHLWRHSYCYIKIKGLDDDWVCFSRHRDCCKISYDVPDEEETVVCNQDFTDYARRATCIVPALWERVIHEDFSFGGNNCMKCTDAIVKALQNCPDASEAMSAPCQTTTPLARVTWMTAVPNGYRFPLDRQLLSCKYMGVHFATRTLHQAQLIQVGQELIAQCPVAVDAIQIGTGCCQINLVLKMMPSQEVEVENFLVSFRKRLLELAVAYTDAGTLQLLCSYGLLEKIESEEQVSESPEGLEKEDKSLEKTRKLERKLGMFSPGPSPAASSTERSRTWRARAESQRLQGSPVTPASKTARCQSR